MRVAEAPAAIDDPTLLRLFAPLEDADAIGLAVSGGADSLALALLARRWLRLGARKPRVVVLTVDHGLRPESAAEAAGVARLLRPLGFDCRVLGRVGPPPQADIEAAAREARYSLLIAAARAEGLTHIATAHHRDDQAETLLLRLGRGSGVYGLAGMARMSARDGIRLVRPLLDLSRAELAAIVRAEGLPAVDDPHNRDARFARARMRSLMPALAEEGMTAERLAATAGRLRRAAAALDQYVDRLLGSAATVDRLGAVRLGLAAWRGEPEEVRLRALARILRAAGGAEHVPRLESLVSLETGLRAGEAGARTLGGVVVSPGAEDIVFERESGRGGLPALPVHGRFEGVWDRRFRLTFELPSGGAMLAALGPAGRAHIPAEDRSGPPRSLEATPALWSSGRLAAAPLAPQPGEIAIDARCIVAERLSEAVEAEEM